MFVSVAIIYYSFTIYQVALLLSQWHAIVATFTFLRAWGESMARELDFHKPKMGDYTAPLSPVCVYASIRLRSRTVQAKGYGSAQEST